RFSRDWSSDVCSSDLGPLAPPYRHARPQRGRAVHARWHQRGDPRPRRGLLKRVVTIRSSVSRSAKRASATSELEIPTQGPKFLKIGRASCREREKRSG